MALVFNAKRCGINATMLRGLPPCEHVLGMIQCGPRNTGLLQESMALNDGEKKGQKIFIEHCDRCLPQAGAGLGPAILHIAPDFAKRFQVRHGVRAMPSFSEEDITGKELITSAPT